MRQTDPPPAKILLVDDNKLGTEARSQILTEAGYRVESVYSGEDAWDFLRKQRFDVVVTDYKMSGMTGSDLIRLIRDADLPLRVILLSGRAAALGLTEKSTGADEVIAKSSREVPELLRAVKRLSTRSSRQAVKRLGVKKETAPAPAKRASRAS